MYKLKEYYGLDYKDWLLMWEKQDGKCAICGSSFNSPSDAYVDHNHKTDEVRGLLCRNCNFLLGHCLDNIKILKNAIKYLEKKERGK